MLVNNEDTLVLKTYVNNFLKSCGTIFSHQLELVIKPECNQQCEYCYLYQHGDELYPKEKRKSNEEILNNIQLLVNYFIENNIYIRSWHLFAGDLFYDNLWFSIMDILYPYFEIYQDQYKPEIMIPCNLSFIHSDEKTQRVEKYIEKFQNIHVRVMFSWSSDGKYAIDIREKRPLSDEYFDKVFKFLAKYDYGAHPMISYESIDNAIKNFDWWVENYKKYIIPYNPHNYLPAFLEVRNDGWTEESINKYLALLEHIIWYIFSLCHYNANELMKHLYFPMQYLRDHNILRRQEIDLLNLPYLAKDFNIMSCALNKELVINCADLSFIPCHRTAYSFFTGGHFVIENNKIIDIEADEGINGFINQVTANTMFNLSCYGCENRYFCIKGCRGAQFEYNQETYLPIPSVCNLLNNKISYLVKRYHELGVYHELFSQTEFELDEEMKREILKLLKAKGYPEYEYKYG